MVTGSRVPLQQIPFCRTQQNWEQSWLPSADCVAAIRGHDIPDSGKASASLCLGHGRSLGLLSHGVRVTPVRPVSLIAASAFQAPDTCTRMVRVEICTHPLSITRPKGSPGGTQGLLNSKRRVEGALTRSGAHCMLTNTCARRPDLGSESFHRRLSFVLPSVTARAFLVISSC